MSFLLGDDYMSSSENESDEEETITSQTVNQEVSKEKESPAQLLPSADSVLSSVSATTASFLPPKSGAKAQSTVKSFDLLEEQKLQRQEQEKQDQEREKVEISETRRIGRKRPPPPELATTQDQSTKREKKDAKDRVKNQRLKGQAGIGSDFRAWKSETEMALRQQFD